MKLMQIRLEDRWNKLTMNFKMPQDIVDEWFEDICELYTDYHRYYHTLNHIDELYTLYDMYESKLKYPEIVQLAIWFHDVIYYPESNTNEEDSITMFENFKTDAKINHDIVERFILVTKTHKIPNDFPNEYLNDLKFFLDFDLAILGKPRDQYIIYTNEIRNEYLHYPDSAYAVGRVKVLNNILDGKIYFTEQFSEIYGDVAKENIKYEIKYLENKNKFLFNQDELTSIHIICGIVVLVSTIRALTKYLIQ